MDGRMKLPKRIQKKIDNIPKECIFLVNDNINDYLEGNVIHLSETLINMCMDEFPETNKFWITPSYDYYDDGRISFELYASRPYTNEEMKQLKNKIIEQYKVSLEANKKRKQDAKNAEYETYLKLKKKYDN